MITYNISINPDLAKFIENVIKERKYANLSEFFRDLVRREYLRQSQPSIEKILPDDPDLAIIKNRSKTAKFASLSEFEKEFDL